MTTLDKVFSGSLSQTSSGRACNRSEAVATIFSSEVVSGQARNEIEAKTTIFSSSHLCGHVKGLKLKLHFSC
jgi:hypothetical protein